VKAELRLVEINPTHRRRKAEESSGDFSTKLALSEAKVRGKEFVVFILSGSVT
jgi:hypothetical protein